LRVIYDQVYSYFTNTNLFYEPGFRSNFSTDSCLIHLTDFIRFEMDKGNMVGMLLLDLQKAFDTVDHSILFMKLEASGLSNDILSDRTQLVDLSGTHSLCSPINCGIPQGSILGPLLFLV